MGGFKVQGRDNETARQLLRDARALEAAGAYALVLEGILPFVSPRGYRDMMRTVGQMDDKSLRSGGLAIMLAGLVLLYLVR